MPSSTFPLSAFFHVFPKSLAHRSACKFQEPNGVDNNSCHENVTMAITRPDAPPRKSGLDEEANRRNQETRKPERRSSRLLRPVRGVWSRTPREFVNSATSSQVRSPLSSPRMRKERGPEVWFGEVTWTYCRLRVEV